jgi:hypothetical protein
LFLAVSWVVLLALSLLCFLDLLPCTYSRLNFSHKLWNIAMSWLNVSL